MIKHKNISLKLLHAPLFFHLLNEKTAQVFSTYAVGAKIFAVSK